MLEALGLDSTLGSAVNAAMVKEALSGSVKAYEAIVRYSGQEWKSSLDVTERQSKIKLNEVQAEKVSAKESEDLTEAVVDPHDVVIPELWNMFDDDEHEHQIITSGRAGTKSSFAGILGISTITSDEPGAVAVLRKRHNKLCKTVYKEMIRVIRRLGLSKDDFDIGEGEEELTNIEATFVRGNDDFFRMVYLYNPPKNPNAPINVWCQKMELRPDAIHKHVDYRDVPVAWIGKKCWNLPNCLWKRTISCIVGCGLVSVLVSMI